MKLSVDWNIIPKCFPLPMNAQGVRNVKEADIIPRRMVDIKERVGSWRTDMEFTQISEDDFEKDHEKKCMLT